MSKLRRYGIQWLALHPWERGVLMRTALLLPLVWLGLRMLGFKRVRRLAECSIPVGMCPARVGEIFSSPHNSTFSSELSCPNGIRASNVQIGFNQAQRYAQLVAIAARHGFYQANCLHQSLPLCWLLRRQGLPAQLKIGVKPASSEFQAHAWVELDGVSLGQSVVEYQVFHQL